MPPHITQLAQSITTHQHDAAQQKARRMGRALKLAVPFNWCAFPKCQFKKGQSGGAGKYRETMVGVPRFELGTPTMST